MNMEFLGLLLGLAVLGAAAAGIWRYHREGSRIVGAGTTSDGRRVGITAREAQKLLGAAARMREARAIRMPDEKAAIDAMWDAYQRLKELGWKEPPYLRQHPLGLVGIEPGSTGLHPFEYQGEWPDGKWFLAADGGCYSTPLLVRPRRAGEQ